MGLGLAGLGFRRSRSQKAGKAGFFATRPAEQCRTAGNSSETTTGMRSQGRYTLQSEKPNGKAGFRVWGFKAPRLD